MLRAALSPFTFHLSPIPTLSLLTNHFSLFTAALAAYRCASSIPSLHSHEPLRPRTRQRISNKVRSYNWRLYNSQKETIDTSASTRGELPVTVGLMPEPKIRLQVNVAVATEAEGRRVGEDFQVAVCTGVVEQAF
jgi:hypothetical protein